MCQNKKNEHGRAPRQLKDVTKEELFELLVEIRKSYGCIPQQLLCELAEKLSIPVSQIYGAVSACPDFIIRTMQKDAEAE